MSTEQSERIRAALLRAKASRPSNESRTFDNVEQPQPAETREEPETTAADEAEPTENEVFEEGELIEEDEGDTEASDLDSDDAESAVVDGAEVEPSSEVETTLPLIAAGDQARTVQYPGAREYRDLTSGQASEVAASVDSTRSRIVPTLLLAATVVAVVGLSLFLWKNYGHSDSKAQAANAAPLQLQVESQGNGIISIRWNPAGSAIAAAKEGRLVILERDQQPRSVALSADQLKIGHIFYQSPPETTEFRLEVVGASGAVAKESVLALASGKAVEPAAGPPVAPSATEPVPETPKREPVEAKTSKPDRAAPSKTPEPRQAPRQMARAFTPPPARNQSTAADNRALVFEPPPSVPSGSVSAPLGVPDAAARLPVPAVGQVAPPPPPRLAASTGAPLKSGGLLQPPKLIKRVTPVYPATAQSAGIEGKVRFTARIDKQGMVRDLQVVSGAPILVPSATEAVKKWVYEPMLLNGEPTDVVTQIEVNFTLRH